MTEPTRVDRSTFLEELRGFFEAHGRVPGDPRIRDSICEALGRDMKSVTADELGGFSRDLCEREGDAADDLYREERQEQLSEHRLLVLDRFRLFQREQGQSEYVVWSDAFYEDPGGEEEKVYRCPIDYDFPRFVENYELTGLDASADTVLARPDFRQMLIVFHHGWYEFYDAAFAGVFLEYFRR
jgi:hypothetical protein